MTRLTQCQQDQIQAIEQRYRPTPIKPMPDGWDEASDDDATLEIVHVRGPAVVLRCDWAARYGPELGYRAAERPAFFMLACGECWSLKVDAGLPGFDAKVKDAARHVTVDHPAAMIAYAADEDVCHHCDGGYAERDGVFGDLCVVCRKTVIPPGFTAL